MVLPAHHLRLVLNKKLLGPSTLMLKWDQSKFSLSGHALRRTRNQLTLCPCVLVQLPIACDQHCVNFLRMLRTKLCSMFAPLDVIPALEGADLGMALELPSLSRCFVIYTTRRRLCGCLFMGWCHKRLCHPCSFHVPANIVRFRRAHDEEGGMENSFFPPPTRRGGGEDEGAPSSRARV